MTFCSFHVFWVCLSFTLCVVILRESIKWQNCHLWNGLTLFWVTKGPCDEIDFAFFETAARWNLNLVQTQAQQGKICWKTHLRSFSHNFLGPANFLRSKTQNQISERSAHWSLFIWLVDTFLNGIYQFHVIWMTGKKLPIFFVMFGCPWLYHPTPWWQVLLGWLIYLNRTILWYSLNASVMLDPIQSSTGHWDTWPLFMIP